MARLYSTIVLSLTLMIAAVVATLCFIIDPYRIYSPINPTDRAEYNIDLFYYLRLTKAYHLEKLKPDLLIMGSSRAAKITPTLHNNKLGYNAALPGMTIYEMWRYLNHATLVHKPKQLIIALDYPAFFENTPKFRLGYSDYRLAEAPNDLDNLKSLKRHSRDLYPTLLSSSAITNSIHAFLDVQQSGKTFLSDGTWAEEQRNNKFARKNQFFRIAKQYYSLSQNASARHDMTYLRKIVQLCHSKKINTVFYISPAHFLTISAYDQANRLENYYLFHREVLTILDEDARMTDSEPFALFGFQNDLIATDENIVSANNIKPLFRDAVHFTFTYGDIIRSALLSTPDKSSRGTLINKNNINQYFNDIDSNLLTFKEDNVNLILDFFNKTDNKKNG